MDDRRELSYLFHTGSTLLNLALTGDAFGGWPAGRVSNIVGDKSTGKTLLAIEAATLLLKAPPKGVKKPRVIYHEGEEAFDESYAASLGLPVDKVEFQRGDQIEDLHKGVEEACKSAKKGSATLFIVDSLDSLSSKTEDDMDIDEKSYNLDKQKKLGEFFRKKIGVMRAANLHLMIISQIRENIDRMPFAPKWRRSGGKSLDFYASNIVWLFETKKFKHPTTDLVYGINIRAKVTKNKVAPPFREVEFPILFDYGVDDTYSIIKHLCKPSTPSEFRIKKKGGWFNYNGENIHLEEFINKVESDEKKHWDVLCDLQDAWDKMEDQSKVQRTNKSDRLEQFRKCEVTNGSN